MYINNMYNNIPAQLCIWIVKHDRIIKHVPILFTSVYYQIYLGTRTTLPN